MEYLSMHPANRLEEPQVRPTQPLALGDSDDDRRAGVTSFVNGMAEPWKVPAGSVFRRDRPTCERVPLLVGHR